MQGVEAPFPELAVALDPGRRIAHGRRHELAVVNATVPVPREQARPFQHLQVFRDRRERHLEGPREFAHARLGLEREPGEDRPAGRIRQGSEGRIEGSGIVNHLVNYIASGKLVKRAGKAPS